MTVIAWDGKTLAADRLMCNGYTKQATTKIFRHEGWLIGYAGNLSAGRETMQWYKDGASAKDYPASNRGEGSGASLIVVTPAGEVWKYESSPEPFRVEGEFCAFGSGDEAALVAMASGHDAVSAVQMAIRFNSSCGLGIDSLELAKETV